MIFSLGDWIIMLNGVVIGIDSYINNLHTCSCPVSSSCIHVYSAHQALADVHALKKCLFATEIKAHMTAIPIRSAKEEEKHWKARAKIRIEMKKLVFNFGKSVSQSLARKMAREEVTTEKT